MLDIILQGTFLKIVINITTIAFWEMLFLVLFTYVMMGEFPYLEQPEEAEFDKLIQSSDYGRVFVPALVSSIISSTLRYTGGDMQVTLPLSVLSMLITIVLFGDIFNNSTAAKWIMRAVAFSLLGTVVMFCSEYLYMPIIIYTTDISIHDINHNSVLNLVFALPSIAMQYLFLIFIAVKKRTFLKGKIFKVIFESRLLSTITLFILIIDFIFIIVTLKSVEFDKILINQTVSTQVFVITSTFLFPILNISALIYSIYYISNNEKSRQKKASDSIHDLIEKIQSSMDEDSNNNAGQIKLNMMSFNHDLLEIADYLFPTNKEGERTNE